MRPWSGIELKLKARYFFSVLLTVVALGFFMVQYSNTSGPMNAGSSAREESPEPEPTYPAWMTSLVTASEDIPASSVYTFDCETIERKPESLTSTCADYGMAIFNIKWKIWGATGAFGTGTYSENQCKPNCAEGTRVETPVSIQLRDLLFDGKKYYLSRATITPLNPNQDLLSIQDWDLGDFYRDMWFMDNS
jgi:hypothetical protein